MKKILFNLATLVFITHYSTAQTFDATLAAKLQNTIDSMRIASNLKGISASVICPGQGMWKGVAGESHQGVPISSDMLFGVGNNSKLFTAVLLLKLSENNLLSIDDSLYKWLPIPLVIIISPVFKWHIVEELIPLNLVPEVCRLLCN